MAVRHWPLFGAARLMVPRFEHVGAFPNLIVRRFLRISASRGGGRPSRGFAAEVSGSSFAWIILGAVTISGMRHITTSTVPTVETIAGIATDVCREICTAHGRPL